MMNTTSSLKLNVIANFLGSFGSAVLSFVFIPQYIKYLGPESYGLIGFYMTLAGVIAILDFGIGASIFREMPKFRISDELKIETIIFLRSFEMLSITIAICIALVIAILSNPISVHWLNQSNIDHNTIRIAVILMGLIIAVRWPNAIYIAALNGLEKQVVVNILSFLSTLAASAGVLVILIFWKPTIINFFLWQAIVYLTFTLLGRYLVWKNVRYRNFKGYFSTEALLKVKRFALGIGMTAVFSAAFTQMDKVILSKLLNLETFGYYTIAASIAAILFKFVYPVSQAISPRMVHLINNFDETGLGEFYQQSSQLIAWIIIPIGVGLAFFSREIIFLWSNNQDMTEKVYPITSILVLGTMLNGLINVPYALQVAYGYTKIIFYQNLIAVILLMPLMYFLTISYGVKGAASVWLILNICYVTISQVVLHQKYLRHERNNWFIHAIFKPLFITILLNLVGKNLMLNIDNFYLQYTTIICTGLISLLCCGFAMGHTRKMIKSYL